MHPTLFCETLGNWIVVWRLTLYTYEIIRILEIVPVDVLSLFVFTSLVPLSSHASLCA